MFTAMLCQDTVFNNQLSFYMGHPVYW